MSKKLARLQCTTGGPKSRGKRRRVRAFVARDAARDFHRIILVAGIVCVVLFCTQIYAYLT